MMSADMVRLRGRILRDGVDAVVLDLLEDLRKQLEQLHSNDQQPDPAWARLISAENRVRLMINLVSTRLPNFTVDPEVLRRGKESG